MDTDTEVATREMATDDDAKQQSARAPYMSYKSLQNYLTRFAEEGLPARFDGSYFGNASGSLVAQVRGSFRYLGLIDEDKHPTGLLKEIVEADEAQRKRYMRTIFEEKYADALALSRNATAGQLAEVFRERGLSGATVQKAITFFLGMADDVEVELSPHFRKARSVASGSSGRKRRAVKATEPTPDQTAVIESTPTSVEAQKAAYVTMLMDLAKNNNEAEAQQGLLDRIEKALGIGGDTAPSGGEKPTDLP